MHRRKQRQGGNRVTETTAEMIESVEKVLGDHEMAKSVVRQILDDFGGMQIYLPMASNAFKDDDDVRIYDDFDGTNHREICRKYNISFATFYNIIRREKDRRAGERSERLQSRLDFDNG